MNQNNTWLTREAANNGFSFGLLFLKLAWDFSHYRHWDLPIRCKISPQIRKNKQEQSHQGHSMSCQDISG